MNRRVLGAGASGLEYKKYEAQVYKHKNPIVCFVSNAKYMSSLVEVAI